MDIQKSLSTMLSAVLAAGLVSCVSSNEIKVGKESNVEAATLAPLGDVILSQNKPKEKMNVLFIAVDDLRTQLGCYGREQIISPNIDSIARDGMVFENAYCHQAVCAPSRATVLTGLRPDSTTIYDLETPVRSVLPNVLTLPEHFKNNGYETISIGKIYHHANDDLQAWSKQPYRAPDANMGYLAEESLKILKVSKTKNNKGKIMGPPFEAPDVPDNAYKDGKNTDYAIEELRRIKKEGKPFFFAMGFSKPHLPFNAPKKYWDMYQPEKLNLAPNPFKPEGVTQYSLTTFGELRNYYGMPKEGFIPDDIARQLIHGYHACVSFTDAQIGRILKELDQLGLRENTIVILWGDHGWKLGEHGSWCKHTNFEIDTNAPMIISVPGMKDANKRSKELVEFVDMYPSLCELSGLSVPTHLEGLSFAPLLSQPDRPWKKAAFSQFPRGVVMGYTMRTKDFRYTEWKNKKTGEVMAKELYDHKKDIQENINVVDGPEYATTVKQLSDMLNKGWRDAFPGKSSQ